MKLTLIAKNSNFCNKNLIESAKKHNITINTIDFEFLEDALNYDKWGDVILWRSSNLDNIYCRNAIYEYLHNIGKKIINLGQSDGIISSKYYQQYKVLNYCKKHKYTSVKYIPTYKIDSLEKFKYIKQLNFPIIEKPDKGCQGNSVRLIKNIEDISPSYKENIYQNYIPNDGDYRILCLGGTVLGSVKRVAKDGDIRNNISQGGCVFTETDEKILNKLENISLQVTSIFNLNLCGIDVILDKITGEFKFLEVNSLVWWEGFSKTTGIDVGDKIIKHCIDLYDRNKTKTEVLVEKYYDMNIEHLGNKKFHYISRMYLWFKEDKYKQQLLYLKKSYIGKNENDIDNNIKKILGSNIDNLREEYRNENDIRKNILNNYPNLLKYSDLLFKFLFSLKIYNQDISKNILKYINIEELSKYYDILYKNHEHLCKLSTLAINYLYNINFFLKYIKSKKIVKLIPSNLISIGKNQFKNSLELYNKFNLELYYYTHIIIGASEFYSKKITENQKDYLEMIKICENIIKKNYFDINIDNKLEFLVCAKLLDYNTSLFEIIYSECKNSLSDIGNFLVDKYNKYSNLKNKNSLIQSEHRNILFLMAFKK